MDIEKVLILDDEMIIRRTLQEYCHRKRIKVRTAGTIQEAMDALQGDHGFDLMFLDINLPDGDGTEILEAMEGRDDAPLAVMITGQGTIESAVTCMQLGAYDYLLKPFSMEQIDLVLQRISKVTRLVQLNRELSAGFGGGTDAIIGESPEISKLKELIECVARTDATVMITGETGTGKELIAQAIHQSSLRKDKPFIKVNCAAVSESLIESEFFGHEKGAFTGATTSRTGRFELADGGTILLDEISEVSLSVQAKLLRVLQEKELERVGGSKTVKVDVRIIATTNRDLKKSIEAGEFRQDLYYRLNVFPVRSPALRERDGDVRRIARHFLNLYGRKHGRKLKDFSQQACLLLERHSWPGNVRELQNVVERSVILSGDSSHVVDATVLPLEIQVLQGNDGEAREPAVEAEQTAVGDFREVQAGSDLQGNEPEDELVPASGSEGGGDAVEAVLELSSEEDWKLENMERHLILKALQYTEGNRTRAAEMMQISIRTLFNKLNQYKKKGYAEFESYFNN